MFGWLAKWTILWELDVERLEIGMEAAAWTRELGLARSWAGPNPARRAGVGDRKGALQPGLDADLVVLDPNGPARPLRSSASDAFEAFPGFTSTLAFREVLLRGESRVRDGQLTQPQAPGGILLQPSPASLSLP